MKQVQIVVGLLLACVCLSSQQQSSCNSTTNCMGPACRCMSTNPPGNLALTSTPQLVILTFDGAITKAAIQNYTSILQGRLNPNGCPISTTFFVNHEYNDYNLTNLLYNRGQEIATHSISATATSSDEWGNMNASRWAAEIGGMRDILVSMGRIPKASIRGARAPYLQTSGDATMQAMISTSMSYDFSFATVAKNDPPIWPYTLDQGYQHDCVINPCPTSKYPGLWTFPVVAFNDVDGSKHSSIEACVTPKTREDTKALLMNNFQRHYNSSKAPFVVALNANAFFAPGHTYLGYIDFLNTVLEMNDVFVVSMGKALDWMKNPLPLPQAGNMGGPLSCPTMTPVSCTARTCSYDYGTTNGKGDRFAVSCTACPDLYPWTCNPLGLDPPSKC